MVGPGANTVCDERVTTREVATAFGWSVKHARQRVMVDWPRKYGTGFRQDGPRGRVTISRADFERILRETTA